MSARIVPLVALAAVGAALASGCGGGGSSSSTTAALTKDEFIAKADAICKQGNQDVNAEAKKTFSQGQQPSQQQVTQFVNDALIPSIQSQVDGIRALTPPAGDEDTINAMLDDVESALDQAKQDPASVVSGGGTFAKANQEAQAYGLRECGKG